VVENQIKKLVEQLFETEDLRTAQNLAVELQRAIYGQIEQLQWKLAQFSSDNPEDKPAAETDFSQKSLEVFGKHESDES